MSEEDFWDDDDLPDEFPSDAELQQRLEKLGICCPMCDEYFWSGRLRAEHMVQQHQWVYRMPRTMRDRPNKGFCHCGLRQAHARGLCMTCITRERDATGARKVHPLDNETEKGYRRISPTKYWRD